MPLYKDERILLRMPRKSCSLPSMGRKSSEYGHASLAIVAVNACALRYGCSVWSSGGRGGKGGGVSPAHVDGQGGSEGDVAVTGGNADGGEAAGSTNDGAMLDSMNMPLPPRVVRMPFKLDGIGSGSCSGSGSGIGVPMGDDDDE